MQPNLKEILKSVEAEYDYQFNLEELMELSMYTMNKLNAIKKELDYFPILFEENLINHITGNRMFEYYKVSKELNDEYCSNTDTIGTAI